jgi:mercuric ion transport protein
MATQQLLNGFVAEPRKTVITAASTGGLITAVLASLCCIGPVVFAALGVGVGATGLLADTAGVLKGLLPYRPLFIGLTTIFLGVGFYLAYRRPMVGDASCQACVSASGARPNRWLLWIIAGLAVALVLAPYWLELATGS